MVAGAVALSTVLNLVDARGLAYAVWALLAALAVVTVAAIQRRFAGKPVGLGLFIGAIVAVVGAGQVPFVYSFGPAFVAGIAATIVFGVRSDAIAAACVFIVAIAGIAFRFMLSTGPLPPPIVVGALAAASIAMLAALTRREWNSRYGPDTVQAS